MGPNYSLWMIRPSEKACHRTNCSITHVVYVVGSWTDKTTTFLAFTSTVLSHSPIDLYELSWQHERRTSASMSLPVDPFGIKHSTKVHWVLLLQYNLFICRPENQGCLSLCRIDYLENCVLDISAHPKEKKKCFYSFPCATLH